MCSTVVAEGALLAGPGAVLLCVVAYCCNWWSPVLPLVVDVHSVRCSVSGTQRGAHNLTGQAAPCHEQHPFHLVFCTPFFDTFLLQTYVLRTCLT